MTNPTQLYKVLPGGMTCRLIIKNEHFPDYQLGKEFDLTEQMEEGKEFSGVEQPQVKPYWRTDWLDATKEAIDLFQTHQECLRIFGKVETRIAIKPIQPVKETCNHEALETVNSTNGNDYVYCKPCGYSNELQAVDANKEVDFKKILADITGATIDYLDKNIDDIDTLTAIEAMRKTYELGQQSPSIDKIVGFVLDWFNNSVEGSAAHKNTRQLEQMKADIIKELKIPTKL